MLLILRAARLTRCIRLTSLVLAWLSFTPLPARAADSEAEDLFRRGSAELEAEAPDYERAYRTLKLAYERGRDYRVLASLAHAAEGLERDGEAIQAYAEYLAQGGDAVAPEERAQLERALHALQSNVARVTLASSVSDVMLIDSRVGSEAPPQIYHLVQGRLELELRPGTHLLTAVNGADRREWQMTLFPGDRAEHRFEFSSKQRATITPTRQERAVSSSSLATLRTAAIGAAGIGSAALVAGAVTGLLVLAKEEDARSQCRKGPLGTVCPESSRGDFDSAKRYATATNILLAAGGATAVAGIGALLFASTRGNRAKAQLVVQPELSARSTGLSVSGSF